MRPLLVLVLLLGPTRLHAQAGDSIVVATPARSVVLSGRTLDSLSSDTVVVSFHDRPASRYVGIAIARVLALAGDTVSGMRGRQFERALVVEAADGYRMVFGVGELDPSVTGRTVVLVRAPGSEGPWRLVVAGDQRGARSVRQVRSLRLRGL